MENLAGWQGRWDVLSGVIDSTEKALPSGTKGEQAVRGLLRGLRAFGERQIRYFLTHPSPIPERYPDDFALSCVLDQTARNLEAIERLAHQRAWGPLTVQAALDRADEWAHRTIQPARRWLSNGPLVLTYLRGTTVVQAPPYLPVMLASLPYTGVQLGDRPKVVDAYALLALPRELGRYLFKHGQIARESIRAVMARAASPLSSWSRPWMEAVFADVYACLVVGPAAALYAQDVALALSQDQFIREDDDRLPPILVPKVYARTLERLSLDDWADSLCKRWRDRLLQRRAPAVFRLNVPVAEMCLDHPRDELVVMVDAACDLLQTCAPSPKESWRSFYMHMAAYAPYELEALYSDFLRQLEQLPSMEADEAYSQLGRDAAVFAEEDWPERFIAQDRADRRLAAPAIAADEAHDWLAVLRAGGWIERGLLPEG